MAIIGEIAKEEYEEWLSTRPAIIQEMARKYPPNVLYQLESGSRGCIHAYNEGGTVEIEVTGKYNRTFFDRIVFGVDPAKLVECDIPDPKEVMGEFVLVREPESGKYEANSEEMNKSTGYRADSYMSGGLYIRKSFLDLFAEEEEK